MVDEHTCRNVRAQRALLRRYEERVDAVFALAARVSDALAHLRASLATLLRGRRSAHH